MGGVEMRSAYITCTVSSRWRVIRVCHVQGMRGKIQKKKVFFAKRPRVWSADTHGRHSTQCIQKRTSVKSSEIKGLAKRTRVKTKFPHSFTRHPELTVRISWRIWVIWLTWHPKQRNIIQRKEDQQQQQWTCQIESTLATSKVNEDMRCESHNLNL